MLPPMDKHPWMKWVPGALSKNQVKNLQQLGLITSRGSLEIGACSIDLSLSSIGFHMEGGSTKPSAGVRYSAFLHHRLARERDGSFRLRRKRTYVFELQERLGRKLALAGFHGQATAKSSVGRLDVLARLIVDGMDRYECFDPDHLKDGSGKMYLEITPITFNVMVRPGLHVSQLRLFYGDPKDSEIPGKELCKTVLGPEAQDRILTLDLSPDKIGNKKVSAFGVRTSKSSRPPLRLWAKDSHSPWEFWRFVRLEAQNELQIRRGHFYILRSKERLYVPNGVAIYCRASDETIGEMRIHYAGFVHPGFGMNRKDSLRGTPLIFEVRGHQVNAKLRDGEKMANLIFYRMSAQDDDSLEENTSYNDQNLKLSNIFSKWPDQMKVDSDGNVEPA